jgi:hypothetical protein
LKPLPFDPAKPNGLSERLIRSHWENNYGGSVKALAVVKKRLAQALGDKDLPAYVYNAFGSFDTWETEFRRSRATSVAACLLRARRWKENR